MPEKALAASRFWQIWTILGVLGTALGGARLLFPTRNTQLSAPSQASARAKRALPQGTLAPVTAAAPSVDRLLARLAVAASATERCALLERVQPSEDAQSTYAITALLERALLTSVRVCATRALGRQPTIEAQSFLLDLADDPEPEVQRSALEALAIRDEAARAAVVEATHSEDLELRVSAVNALLKGKRAEAYAAAALVLPQIEDPETLSSLIDALAESGDPQALPTLEGLLEHADRESHVRAISALGELGVPGAAARLESLLEVGSSEEFSSAAEALKKVSSERVIGKLRTVLSSGNRWRQELALSALLSLDLPELSSIMRQELKSDDPKRMLLVLRHLSAKPDPTLEAELIAIAERLDHRLRLPAARALWALATPGARAALARLASSLPESLAQRFSQHKSDDPEQLRAQRISSLTRAEHALPATLVELARDPAPAAQTALLRYLEGHEVDAALWARVVQAAPASTVEHLVAHRASSAESAQQGLLEGLGRRGDPNFTHALRESLHGEKPARNAALSGLVQLGDESVLPELERLSRSDELADRELAVQLLGAIPTSAAQQELERLGSDPNAQIMSGALHALQARSPELVAKLAQQALRAYGPEERASAISLLADLKASLSRPLLERALADPEDTVAVQAIQSLTNLQGATSARQLLGVVNDSRRSEQVRAEAASGLRTLGGPLARANRALLDALSAPEEAGEFVCNPN